MDSLDCEMISFVLTAGTSFPKQPHEAFKPKAATKTSRKPCVRIGTCTNCRMRHTHVDMRESWEKAWHRGRCHCSAMCVHIYYWILKFHWMSSSEANWRLQAFNSAVSPLHEQSPLSLSQRQMTTGSVGSVKLRGQLGRLAHLDQLCLPEQFGLPWFNTKHKIIYIFMISCLWYQSEHAAASGAPSISTATC